jgi:hypothetical protein
MLIKPAKPIWWKIAIGSLLVVTQIANFGRTVSRNYDQQQGANSAQVILIIVGGWLVYSGMAPVRNARRG